MKTIQWIYNGYFKAQDAFFSSATEDGYELDIVYNYIYYTRLLSAHYSAESEHRNTLLCEYFLHQTFAHFITAIQDPTRSTTFRQLSLDSIHNILFELRKHYQTLNDGQEKYLELKHKLQTIRI